MVIFFSSWGKMGERSDKPAIQFVGTNSSTLGELLYGPSRIIKSLLVLDETVIIAHAPRIECLEPCRFSRVVYAAITTATARLKLLEAMEKTGDNLIYIGN